MGRGSEEFPVYVEAGEKRVFAAAIDWPVSSFAALLGICSFTLGSSRIG
jgi:hypothetical protein